MTKRAIDSQNIGSSLKRYKGVTISIAIFLLFTSGVMYSATLISKQIHERQVQIDAAGILSDNSYDVLVAVQSVHQEILEQAAEHDGHEHGTQEKADHERALKEYQAKLTDTVRSFDEILAKLEKGGGLWHHARC